MTSKVVGRKNNYFSKHVQIIYHSKGLSLLATFLPKDHDLKVTHEETISHFFFVCGNDKILQGTSALHN